MNLTQDARDFDTQGENYAMIHMNAAIYPRLIKLLMLTYQINLFGLFFLPLFRSECFLWRCSSQPYSVAPTYRNTDLRESMKLSNLFRKYLVHYI